MGVEINYLAVFLAALSSMVVGSLWYSPATFGKAWMKLARVKPDRSKMTPVNMIWLYGSVFIASWLTALVLAHVTFLANYLFRDGYLYDAILTSVWLWVGFTATRLYVHDAFEERRKKLTILNALHELVTVLIMAVIIGLLKP